MKGKRHDLARVKRTLPNGCLCHSLTPHFTLRPVLTTFKLFVFLGRFSRHL